METKEEEEDEIQTPSTSRSNSMDEDEDRTTVPIVLRSNLETIQNESSSPKNRISNISEQIKATIASKRDTFISTSSESETDYVAVDKQELETSGLTTSLNGVSLLAG